jgi:hypothetical protein
VKNNTKWITRTCRVKKRNGRRREWNMNRYFHRSLSSVTKLHLKLWPSLYNGQRSEVNRTHYQKNALTLKNATAFNTRGVTAGTEGGRTCWIVIISGHYGASTAKNKWPLVFQSCHYASFVSTKLNAVHPSRCGNDDRVFCRIKYSPGL